MHGLFVCLLMLPVYIPTDVGRALLRSGVLGEAHEGPRSVAHTPAWQQGDIRL